MSVAVTASRPANATCPTNTFKGYTVSGISLISPVILSANYFDNHYFRGANGIPAGSAIDASPETYYNTWYSNPKGLLTGTLSAVLDANATPSQYLYSVMYYDYKGQVVQTQSNNHLGGTETEYVAYTFTGQPTKRKHTLTVGGTTTTENYRYDYDHAERLINTIYRLNSENEVLLSANAYDELGRLKTVTPYQRTDFRSTYSYDIRSRIREITGTNFSESLEYTFGSNISKMLWTTGGVQRGYSSLAYDNLSRLKTATYSGSENYSVYYGYDKNGNITGINRGAYDNLRFSYNSTNQLFNGNDSYANSSLSSVYEFKNYSTGTGQEYWYNTNGSMTKDLNRGISEITYNLLNLPLKVDMKNPVAEARNEYSYSASGRKLKAINRWASSYSTNPVIGSAINTASLNNTKTTDYIGNFVYENGVLKRILTENGYYENNNYYFYVRNHLGSNAIVADQNGNIIQQNHYYPYGMTMSNSNGQSAQPYKFTGKELDSQHGLNLYDFDARTYDPSIGRFTTVDPLAEKYYSISPYAYCADNPVNTIDTDGRDVIALNSLAQQAILNTLPKDIRSSIVFNENGGIDKTSFNAIKSESGNFASLSQLVNDTKIFEVNVADKISYKDGNGKTIEQSMGEITLSDDKNGSFGFNTGEEGWQGVTQTPGNAPNKYNSPDNNVKIVVNSGLSPEGQAQTFAHEGYGHAKLYSQGEEHRHQVNNTPEGFMETNKSLSTAINKAIEETIKNMGGK